ncbi:MAG: L,D-transpeptidase [Verrucomicrobiota bacterium]
MTLIQNCWKPFSILLLGLGSLFLVSCGGSRETAHHDSESEILVSVTDQRMLLMKNGKPVKMYAISTSKFGLGNERGSMRTPLGNLEVAQKIGGGAKPGAVFKGRRPTGEVLKPNAPGRDPIVTRILWLRGKETHNANTFRRLIYIHGTPEEKRIGRPASYGCIRMRSRDVIDLYNRVGVGADVRVIRGSLERTPEGRKYYAKYGKWMKDRV